MDVKQQYIDDLKRRGLVPQDGTVPAILPPAAYFCQPFIPADMSPEQWRDLVLENFRDVYLAWWTTAFQALLEMPLPKAAMTKTVVPIYNPDTQLWDLTLVNIDGSKED